MVTVYLNGITNASFHRNFRDALTVWGRHGFLAQLWIYNHGHRYKKPSWIAVDEFGYTFRRPDKSLYEISWKTSGEYPLLEGCMSKDWVPNNQEET